MKVKLTLPETIEDITLGQYQELTSLEDNDTIKKVSIITGLTVEDLEKVQLKDLNEISNQIDEALAKEGKFKPIFTMKGVDFGMIPNFDKIKSKEYIDLSTYGVEIETLHKVMAILYRPIKSKGVGNTYDIHEYEGTEEWSEIMKQMPLSYVNGVLAFFLTLQKELKDYFLKFTIQEQARVKLHPTTLLNGDGMLQSMN
jgi:hypothetical protein